MIKKAFLAIALAVVIFTLTGCQTVAGLGEDITWSAQATADMIEGQ